MGDSGADVVRGDMLIGTGAPGQPALSTLLTDDPDEAAAEAERLLAGWAWSR